MVHGHVDLHEHNIVICPVLHEHCVVLCPDYLRKMWSGNKTKHRMVPAGAHPQARPKAAVYGIKAGVVVQPDHG